MKELTDFAVAFKLVWFRALCYFFIPAGTLFLTQTETWSDSTWAAMGAFLKTRLFLACIIAGSTSLAAYVDASLGAARKHNEELKQKRLGDTSFINRPVP